MAYSIAVVIILGLSADYLFRRLKLPGLVGMLAVGVLAGPYALGLMSPEMMAVSADFRKIALIVILLRAGLELRRDQLQRVGRAAVVMSMVPAVFEIAGVMLVAPHLLEMTLIDAALLGAILAAVSPAVVVPLMIDFIDRGRGAKKGIPTLILGASSLDDVFVIVIFSALLSMAGGGDADLAARMVEIPLSVALGILAGLIPGYLLYRLFSRFDLRPPKRTLIVVGVAIGLTWLEEALAGQVAVASLLGVMAIGYMLLEKIEPVAHLISRKLKAVWVFAELLLFVLVGAQVNIDVALDAGLAGAAVVFVGLVFRSAGTLLSLVGTKLTVNERLFCVVAYVPKATVQAAIGAFPLAAGIATGEVILAVAVLSILITAPLGAVGIAALGERILDRGERSVYRFKDLRTGQQLPRAGERIRARESGTVWKVIEEQELWLSEPDAGKGAVPAIRLRLWAGNDDDRPGTGKTRDVVFHHRAPAFEEKWEILYDF